MTLFSLLLGPPLASALLAMVVRPYRRYVAWVNAMLSLCSLGAAVVLWSHLLAGRVPTSGPGEFLRADALSTLLATCVSLVGALAAWLGPGIGLDDGYDAAEARRFRIFGNLFTFTMLFAVTSNNVGFMWIAVEATTITSALLIPRSPVLPQLIGVTSRFDRFVELDRPAYCEAVLSVVAADQAAVRCVIRQEGGAAAELELAFLGEWQALWRSVPIPTDPFVARQRLCVPVREAIARAFLSGDEALRPLLTTLGTTAFVPVSDADYRAVRERLASLH